ncbi:MAG: polysaccharide biosynthesis/export family protein [Armatimonadota bacterium]
MARILAALLLILILSVACIAADEPVMPVQPAAAIDMPATVDAPPVDYRLQKEDSMRISVWGEPNLTTQQVVDPQGFIRMLLVGQMYVEGFTLQELVDKIGAGLSEYLIDPKIQVELIQFHRPKVYVLGQVNRPGLYEFKMGDTIMEAIAQSGSFREDADLADARITHRDSNEQMPLDLHRLFFANDMSQNQKLQDGDTIFIPEDTMNKYFVLGEVLRQGMYKWKKGVTVVDALSNASGPTDRAELGSTYVLRGDMKNPERIKVDMGKILKKGEMDRNVVLQPGDVVYIAETNKPNWDKIGRMLSIAVNSSYLLRMLGL